MNAQSEFNWCPEKSRLEKLFEKYDAENPQVWEKFKEFAFQAIGAGRKRLAARVIIERIRWYTTVEAKSDEFKINNNYTPYYARKFIAEYPKYKDFFQMREIRNT